MFAHCEDPIWQGDDLDHCFQINFLKTVFPLIACTLSVLVLLYQGYLEWLHSQNNRYSFQLAGDECADELSAAEEETDSLADLTLQKIPSRADSTVREINKPKGEIVLVTIELLALLGQLGVSFTTLANSTEISGTNFNKTAIAGLVVWGYVSFLAALRLFLSLSIWQLSYVKLWSHTAVLYSAQWLLEIMVFRSTIIHPRNERTKVLISTEFALATLLIVVALTSRKGNRPVILEYENDLEPSHEPLASVISLASFSWADPLIWRGYKKTLELSDVWNINVRDKATFLLAEFRQVKKTHSLAVRLLIFFQKRLIIQGAWAMLESVCMFIPTLLLRAILEYVEDPESIPRNTAWLYVILLFFIGTVQAVASGQGLWIGRKVCIHLRALIVGEIYSKALRRKAAASTDSQLGKSKDEQQQSFLKRVLSFGRCQKAPPKSSEDSAKTKTADAQANNGTIINLMSIDSFKVAEVCAYLHFLWAAVPIQFAMAIALLYKILGYSSFAGIVMLILLSPINFIIAISFRRAQKKIMAATDARIHSTNEVLQNIRIIKYFAWEQRFAAAVNDKRMIELKNLRKRYIIWALAATVWSGIPILITFTSFFVYTVIEGKALRPSVAFPALSTFALLRLPLDQLAGMIAHVQESKVSVDRVEEFLKEEETEKYVQLQQSKNIGKGEVKIALENATLTWGSKKKSGDAENLDSFRLININVTFQLGRLNIIAGQTGSGKTSLIMALLGEMKLINGQVRLPGGFIRQELHPDHDTGLTEGVAYCAQQAWLVNASIKDNILFASPYDENRYKTVVAACALESDLKVLDAGDQTLVGEKGIALSGGQKQRISLARALYCNSRHLLLDDCLSAVDSHAAKHIVENAILGELMANRTCILVTHNLTLTVPHSSYVVVLDNGKIAAQGPPDQMMASGALGEEYLRSQPASAAASAIPSRVPSNLEEETAKLSDETNHLNGNSNGNGGKTDKSNKAMVDIMIEKKAEGRVKVTTVKMYLKSMGPWYFWAFAAFSFIATQSGSVATSVWIRQWANSYQTQELSPSNVIFTATRQPAPFTSNNLFGSFSQLLPGRGSQVVVPVSLAAAQVNLAYYLGVYALLGIVYLIICCARELLLFWGSLHASWHIHDRLLTAIMRAKFKFFDSTPIGQLMNRFSKDMQSIDQEVTPVAIGMIHSLVAIIVTVLLISVIIPGFLIAGFFIGLMYFATGYFYIHSSRDLKRIEAVQRSPLFQGFGETLSGVVTIRAYGDESRFLRENHNRVNTHNRPSIYLGATNRWLALRVDIAGALVDFFCGVFVILSIGRIDAGAAGLTLTYAITFTENVLWLVRLYAANEQNMNAVERIKEYIEVEQEAKAEIPETKPAANWPSRGNVQFVGYSTRYRSDLGLVLKNISFNIQPGEKVGIVGRTGAGKSSLALALFRGLEAEEGKILIDDVDIGLIGLQVLRESITIVPQDPTLFTGTLRSNLDPFGLFTDEEIFTTLRRVQLISSAKTGSETSGSSTPAGSSNALTLATTSLPNLTEGSTGKESSAATVVQVQSNPHENKNIFLDLSSQIAESGSNLSQGQRQLLCLARALLKSPRVLLMDEATASIDYATDAKIQDTLHQIKDNTIITIAHRLQTIIDYDKVLVLEKGEMVEFDHPWELLQHENGSFRSMCQTSGEFDTLLCLAKKAWDSKRLINDS